MILDCEARWRRWCLFGWITAAGLFISLLLVTAVLSRSATLAHRVADEAQAVAAGHLLDLAALRTLADRQNRVIGQSNHMVELEVKAVRAMEAELRLLAAAVDEELPALRRQLAASQATNAKLTAEMNALLRAEHLKRLGMAPGGGG